MITHVLLLDAGLREPTRGRDRVALETTGSEIPRVAYVNRPKRFSIAQPHDSARPIEILPAETIDPDRGLYHVLRSSALLALSAESSDNL